MSEETRQPDSVNRTPREAAPKFEAAHISTPSDRYLNYWGKAQPSPSANAAWHPIAYHLLDVASVAAAMLAIRPRTLDRGAALIGMNRDDAERFLVALASLHDLGKFGRAFQSKRPDLLAERSARPALSRPHTKDGFVLWQRHLADRIGGQLVRGSATALKPLMMAAFGHHGRPVEVERSVLLGSLFDDTDIDAARTCADDVLDLLLGGTPCPEVDEAHAIAASWWTAGLITVCDWVGSHQEWFPYAPPTAPVNEYWSRVQERAASAVRSAGLIPCAPAPTRSFHQVTGLAKALVPTPAQVWASTVSLPSAPTLFLIEDVTGAGKTEAAHMLIHRLMAAGRATGAYWAMPTQATANAMFDRQKKAIDGLFESHAGQVPSLILAHGQSRWHAGFRDTVLGGAVGPSSSSEDESNGAEPTSVVAVAAFLADDRRAGFLADVGAGTVDQAILGVLPSRFNTVRLFGLADKILVIDEAHAYDAYVNAELKTLLTFHAGLGGTAILLSATLSQKQRNDFVHEWQSACGRRRQTKGWGAKPEDALRVHTQDYPLATVVPANGDAIESALEAASGRTLDVRFATNFGDVEEEIISASQAGAAVAWIRNTVDSCVEAARRLRARGVDAMVFHARFAQGDRQQRETEVTSLFGKKALAGKRRGRVLIATQVIEQSLDLDFDLMFSDLAPVDLLLQRAGRLWRHRERNPERQGVSAPTLVIVGPVFDEDPPSSWIPGGLLPWTEAVYARSAVLWRTARAFWPHRAVSVPEDVRMLIESVYASDDAPPALRDKDDKAVAKEKADASTAKFGALTFGDGYDGSAREWLSELRVPTRLGDQQTVLRLARAGGEDELAPWFTAADSQAQAWALSEVRVSVRRVPFDAEVEAAFGAAVNRVRATWGKFEQEIPIVPLMLQGDESWAATLTHPARSTPIELRYTPDFGLQLLKPATA